MYSTTDAGAAITAGAGAMCSSTGAGAADTVGACDWNTEGAGEMYSTTGAGAPRSFPKDLTIT